MAPIDREKLEWRSPIVSRVFGWLFLSLFTIASLACFVAAAFASSALRLVVGGVVLGLMAVALSSLGLLARITATDHGLAVKNWRRTITIEWRDIGRLEASYRGVLVFRPPIKQNHPPPTRRPERV